MPRRRLTPEEREIWRKVAATAAPLHTSPPEPPAPPVAQPQPQTQAVSVQPVATALRVLRPEPPARKPGVSFDLVADPVERLGASVPLMDRRRYERMRRGRLEPEARLDLHGMTADRAHAALMGFVRSAHASGLRLVLVITGKGRAGDETAHAPQRHGVLRHSLPHWLTAPPLAALVLQIAPAHARHGGAGAYYVYLRRAR